MEFRTVSVLKCSQTIVAETLSLQLPALAAGLEDIESIRCLSRETHADGTLELVHEWVARLPELPLVARDNTLTTLTWTELTHWNLERNRCAWTIEPTGPAAFVRCKGETCLEGAMAGRGTRLIFSGRVSVDRHSSHLPQTLVHVPINSIESVLGSVFTSRFRKLIGEIEPFLAGQVPG
jgi:hypothetical protein